MPEIIEDECDRCGKHAPGRRMWMFYGWINWLFGSAIRREFYCFRCLRIMRVYAIIGFALLGLLVGSIVAVTLWLTLRL